MTLTWEKQHFLPLLARKERAQGQRCDACQPSERRRLPRRASKAAAVARSKKAKDHRTQSGRGANRGFCNSNKRLLTPSKTVLFSPHYAVMPTLRPLGLLLALTVLLSLVPIAAMAQKPAAPLDSGCTPTTPSTLLSRTSLGRCAVRHKAPRAVMDQEAWAPSEKSEPWSKAIPPPRAAW
jgi:hypothetical protein